MTLSQLIENKDFKRLTANADALREISAGICCDLLSWVMARGRKDMAWITVQSHMNVVAVAALHEFSCIILSDGSLASSDILQKAEDEGIAVFSTQLSGFQICCLLHEAGVQ